MCDGHLRDSKREKAVSGSKDTTMIGGRPTLFRHLFNSELPASELTADRLSKEAQVLIGSGTITTAGTLGFIVYHIMANPKIKQRLQEELKGPMANYPAQKPSWAELERVEYLQAIIKESLRYDFPLKL